ncbi:hypothetical protein TTHERM_00488240 (macronuclear) [Tetrahymena thermophila SB210]|uniref:AMP-binding enzyme family protein n=1 Tax=Tetrahymena thermophila (strain SB210) TaxID=312017 RepID=Q23JF0_TETTS|nr:hypothetical protein TTHERM_00488240 [Tetrahymena thermophila SB210]EAR96554.2 hypothetical protein TTHERM_00488240 [Tetrahymena thermophila SB210]|eukprot:XP_001016799.2 hypothetical protein TTHERM_00488240 [Tetrahymena thermophila SB210]
MGVIHFDLFSSEFYFNLDGKHYQKGTIQDPSTNLFQTINLNITECTNPQLKDYNCLDFSKISNYSLVLDNSNNIISQLYINIYGCLDIDEIKTTIPNNCANQREIDAVINGNQASLTLQLKTQQYNASSQQIQINYRQLEIYSISNQFILSSFKTQKQDTEVKQGLLFQEQQYYSFPIQYDQILYNFDRKTSLEAGLGPFNQVIIRLDEIVQFTQIQYPTIIQILALVNSFAAVVMVTRILGRLLSQNLIKEDIFILILRNLFQEKCLEILKNSKFISEKGTLTQILRKQKEEEEKDEVVAFDPEEKENKTNLLVPNFQSKFLQKREASNFSFDNSSSFQKNKYSFDEEKEQKDLSKINNNNNLFSISPKILNVKQKKTLNLINFEKFDMISQNESFTTTQQIDNSRMSSLQKKQSISQTKLLKKQQNQPKNNYKNEPKVQENKDLSQIISQRLKVIKCNSIKKLIQNTIFKFKCIKVKEFLQSKGLQQKQLNQIRLEAQKSINIYELYKDIIYLKKAVSMILSLDQMAALQFVGLTNDFMKLDLDEKNLRISYEKEKKKLSHFEKQYLIQQCEELQISQIESFIAKCQENSDLTEIDQRIISSIYKKQL